MAEEFGRIVSRHGNGLDVAVNVLTPRYRHLTLLVGASQLAAAQFAIQEGRLCLINWLAG